MYISLKIIEDFNYYFSDSDGSKTRLVCIPSFAATRTVVILNLRNLECTPMSFMSGVDEE